MDLRKAEELAKDLMAQHLNMSDWQFKWDNSKRRFGVCRWRKNMFGTTGTIGLSKHLVLLNSEEHVTDTILHEIAHALTPGHKHDAVWKAKCIEIGARPERCYDAEEDNVVIPQLRYIAECGGCGLIHQKARMTQRLMNGRTACKCQSGKTWDNKILLDFKDTKL